MMSRIRNKNTAPEMTVRRLLHSLGYRYRLHAKDLPGKPDILFRSRRKAIFVHGYFWHQHKDPSCKISGIPKSRQDFWIPKLRRNAERDRSAISALEVAGWEVLVVWECELKDMETMTGKLTGFLGCASG